MHGLNSHAQRLSASAAVKPPSKNQALSRDLSNRGTTHAASIRAIAKLVLRLSPERGDPESFYLQREEIAARLFRIASTLEAER